MAPRKRKADGAAEPVAAAAVTRRVTRSASHHANAGSVAEQQAQIPKKKAKQTKRGKARGAEAVEEEEVKETENAGGEEEQKTEGFGKTVVIEHCKQCTQFKNRAIKVKEGLEKGVPGITVLVNPNKPRRGCFEIREEGGDTFISLLDMKRPFEAMKALDMEQVISDITDKVK